MQRGNSALLRLAFLAPLSALFSGPQPSAALIEAGRFRTEVWETRVTPPEINFDDQRREN